MSHSFSPLLPTNGQCLQQQKCQIYSSFEIHGKLVRKNQRVLVMRHVQQRGYLLTEDSGLPDFHIYKRYQIFLFDFI